MTKTKMQNPKISAFLTAIKIIAKNKAPHRIICGESKMLSKNIPKINERQKQNNILEPLMHEACTL
jgi:hypothetical protein